MQIDGRRLYTTKMFAGRSEASEVKDGVSQGRRGVATPLLVLRKQDFVRRFFLGRADAEHCWHQPCGWHHAWRRHVQAAWPDRPEQQPLVVGVECVVHEESLVLPPIVAGQAEQTRLKRNANLLLRHSHMVV
jgi:hypothetical protein